MKYITLILPFALALLGCKEQPAPQQDVTIPNQSLQCSKDVDCKGDRICENGKCTNPQPNFAINPHESKQIVPAQQSAIVSPVSSDVDYSGSYVGKGSESDNELQIAKLANGKIKFSVSTTANWTDNIGGRCVGGIDEQIASLHENVATFTNEDGCKLTIKFADGKALVKEDGCLSYHGAQCDFDATYSKVK